MALDCASAASSRRPVEPDRVGRAFVGIKIKPLALALRVKDMAQQQTFERRDVGDRDRRLDHGRGEIIGMGDVLRERGGGPGEMPGPNPAERSLYPAGFTPFPALLLLLGA